MSSKIELNAEVRSDLGKGASRRLRRQADKIPAIIYGDDKGPMPITMLHKDIHKAQKSEAFYASILTINVDGTSVPTIIKDLQRHPAKDVLLHADFLRIDPAKKITIKAPLHFINQDICIGVKMGGGLISHSATEIDISCLPADLPEYIEVDMADIQIDQIVHLSDVVLPEGVSSVALSHGAEHDLPIAQIHLPRGSTDDSDEESSDEAPAEETDAEAPSEDS